jgi:uncharacterized membrane protein
LVGDLDMATLEHPAPRSYQREPLTASRKEELLSPRTVADIGDDPADTGVSAVISSLGTLPSDRATDASQLPAFRLAALMTAAGTLHFVQPAFFDRIIPRALPGRARAYTHASGVAAYAIAVALACPRTRRVGATLAAVFYVAVIPAKVQLTVNWLGERDAGVVKKTAAILHLPWQVPLVTEALKARRSASTNVTMPAATGSRVEPRELSHEEYLPPLPPGRRGGSTEPRRDSRCMTRHTLRWPRRWRLS